MLKNKKNTYKLLSDFYSYVVIHWFPHLILYYIQIKTLHIILMAIQYLP